MILLKSQVWENLVLDLNTKMLSVNQTAGFLNHEWDQACPKRLLKL